MSSRDIRGEGAKVQGGETKYYGDNLKLMGQCITSNLAKLGCKARNQSEVKDNQRLKFPKYEQKAN